MRRFLAFLALLVTVSSTACKKQTFQEQSNVQEQFGVSLNGVRELRVPKERPLYLFTYIDSGISRDGEIVRWPANESGILKWIWEKMAWACEFNRTYVAGTNKDLAFGAGIYVGEDFASYQRYGDSLLMLRASPDWVVHDCDNCDRTQALRSQSPALLYHLDGWFSRRAMVVRHSDFILRQDGLLFRKPIQESLLDYKKTDTNDLPLFILAHMKHLKNLSHVLKIVGSGTQLIPNIPTVKFFPEKPDVAFARLDAFLNQPDDVLTKKLSFELSPSRFGRFLSNSWKSLPVCTNDPNLDACLANLDGQYIAAYNSWDGSFMPPFLLDLYKQFGLLPPEFATNNSKVFFGEIAKFILNHRPVIVSNYRDLLASVHKFRDLANGGFLGMDSSLLPPLEP